MIFVPSWVIPGTYLENLQFLEDKPEIAGVELLFFLDTRETRALLSAEFEALERYASRFIFTAHLPDLLEESQEELISRLAPLVRHFVCHPGPLGGVEAQGGRIRAWGERFGPERFVVENTVPGALEAILPWLFPETPVCMDTGHLLLEGASPAGFFRRYGGRIREIHLHGVDYAGALGDGRLPDHRAFRREEPWFQALGPVLADFGGVLNVEIFSWPEAERTLAALGFREEPGLFRFR
jgi:hypothetical protein